MQAKHFTSATSPAKTLLIRTQQNTAKTHLEVGDIQEDAAVADKKT